MTVEKKTWEQEDEVPKGAQIGRAVIKTVAGMTLTSPKKFIQLAAHAGDLLLQGEFSQALADTYSFFINNGEIDQKYFDSRSFADLAPEFGKVIKGSYGVDKLDVLRKIFANLAKDNHEGSYRKYLLDIALELSEPEIKVLLADDALGRAAGGHEAGELRNASRWARSIADSSGLKHEALVSSAEGGLVEKGLMTGWLYSDKSATLFVVGKGRLTSMGQELSALMTLEDDPIVNEQA